MNTVYWRCLSQKHCLSLKTQVHLGCKGRSAITIKWKHWAVPLTVDLLQKSPFFPLFLHIICYRWCCLSFSAPTHQCTFTHLDLATHLQQHHKGLSYYLQLSIALITSVASQAIDYRQDESPSLCRHGCFRISMEKFNVTDQNWKIFRCVTPKDKEKGGEWHCWEESKWTWGIVNNIRSAPRTHTPTPTPSQ